MTASYIVSPSKIQQELNALWDAKENKNKVRASLFNIIFFTKNSPRSEYIHKIAYKLIEKFPARIFFISSDGANSETSLKCAVAVMTTKQGDFDITCDLIEISTTGRGDEQIPFLLLPHIVPDLPVFLVWAEDPGSDSPLWRELVSFATRVIFDSESAEDLRAFSRAVSHTQTSIKCEIADLNWARLESWRDLIAATFDTPELIEKLQNTSFVTITYNAQETPFFCHTKIQSIYLQAWLATRLSWTPAKKCNCSLDFKRFFYESGSHSIEVQLQEVRNSKLPPGMILGLDLQISEDEHFSFARDLDTPNQISLRYSSKNECKLPTKFMISKGESGLSLIKEICHKGTSEHYAEILQMISNWDRGISC